MNINPSDPSFARQSLSAPPRGASRVDVMNSIPGASTTRVMREVDQAVVSGRTRSAIGVLNPDLIAGFERRLAARAEAGAGSGGGRGPAELPAFVPMHETVRQSPESPKTRANENVSGPDVKKDEGVTPPPEALKMINDEQGGSKLGFNDADVNAVQAALGSSVGERRYNSNYDFDGDGVVSGADLMVVVNNFGVSPPPEAPPMEGAKPIRGDVPFTNDDVPAVKAAFGSTEGERHYNASYDLDGDGKIDGSDLIGVLNSLQPGEGAKAA